jgi:hypothetical protein
MTRLKMRIVAVAFLTSLTVHADSCSEKEYGLHEQEFLCDEADARLTQCCGHEVGLACTRAYGCNHNVPDLAIDTSLCIREKSCDDIVSAGLCTVTDWRNASSLSAAAYAGLRALSCS